MRADYRDYSVTLGAGASQEIGVEGNAWQVLNATGAVVLEFDTGQKLTRYMGMGGPAAQYRSVRITSATAQAITLALGTIPGGMVPYDNRGTLAGVTVQSSITPADTITPGVAVACAAGARTPLCAARADRKSVIASTLSDVASYVVVGDVTVDATHGTPLEPGQPATLDTTAAVYIWNPHATDSVTVWVTELRDLP